MVKVIDFQKTLKELKEKKKKGKKKKGIIQRLEKKVVSKRILKPSQMTVKIPKGERTSTWDEQSSFFKQEVEEAKRSFF